MGIPETQLETWSHQGSITQSSTTYGTIRTALSHANAPYAGKNYEVFLQGSYGNDTNIYAESDVDVVIKLGSCFYHDLTRLPADQQAAFHAANPGTAPYGFPQFKADVTTWLTDQFGASAIPGTKAVQIGANGSRRKADVLVCVNFKRYSKFLGAGDERHAEGICFYLADGTRVSNYPRQHSANCTTKHQAAGQKFKPIVRVMKNLRGKLIEEGMLDAGEAPSYYLEGLLYNVPNDKFSGTYANTFANSLNWLLQADRSSFVCANEQFYLLREGSHMTWRDAPCTKFLNAAADLWRQW